MDLFFHSLYRKLMTNRKKRFSREQVVKFSMATRAMDAVSDYSARGRRYDGLTIEELDVVFIDRVSRWAAGPMALAERREAQDVRAEYDLRGRKAPYHLVKGELDAIAKMVAEQVGELTDERKAEISRKMYDDYEDGQKERN
jgi:hypothetical protein